MDMSASSYPFFFYGTFFTAPKNLIMCYNKKYKKQHKTPKIAHIATNNKTATTLENTEVVAVLLFAKCQRWDIIIQIQNSYVNSF